MTDSVFPQSGGFLDPHFDSHVSNKAVIKRRHILWLFRYSGCMFWDAGPG